MINTDNYENKYQESTKKLGNGGIIIIPAEQIYLHPDNPRKDLGDLSELSDSIKKKGIMQNLTVIPGHWNERREWFEKGYTLIIGHRRFVAGKIAGVTEFPCRIIIDMSQKDQIGTMLEENIQRNDLTIWEQANGFQMMLDLGDTEEQIAEKTGFSKTTIKHRLNIAKLNQKELKKKEQDESFQLTLKDLYELEKISDVRIRNKILKESSNSRDLVSRAQNAVSEAKRDACKKAISEILKKLGVEEAPEEAKNEIWSGKWKTVKEFELDKEPPKQLRLPKEKGQMYWLVSYRTLKVIVKAPKEKRQLSEWELKKKETDKVKRQIKAVLKESSARRREFVLNIISGKINAVKDEAKEIELIWRALIPLGSCVYESTLRRFFLEKDEYKSTVEEKQEAREKSEKLTTLHQMLVILHESMVSTNETYDYNGRFDKTKGDALLKGYEALEPYGWYFESDEEKSVLDGTHEFYKKDKEND